MLATMYSPYVAIKDSTMLRNILLPKIVPALIPSCCTDWIPTTAR